MSFLDNLCKDDDEIVARVIYKDYWYVMSIIGLYPKLDTPKWRLLSGIQFLITCSLLGYFVVIMAITAIKLKDSIMGLCQCIHYAILLLLVMLMVITITTNRICFARIHRGIETGLSDYDQQTEQCRPTLRYRISLYNGRFKKISLIYVIGGLIFLAIVAILGEDTDGSENELYIKNEVSLDLLIPQWSPFSTDTMFTNLIGIILQVTVCTLAIAIPYAMTVLFLNVALNIATELEILIISLERLPERTLYMFQLRHGTEKRRKVDINRLRDDKELSQCYADCLKQNVIHHQRIIQMFSDLATLLSLLLFIILSIGAFYIAISGALIVFAQGTKAERVRATAIFFGEIIQLFLVCWCAEQIIEASIELSRTLYSTNWLVTTKDAAQSVLIMMIRANQPLVMTYKNLLKINFETFANIMNSAYSFFSLINAVEAEAK